MHIPTHILILPYHRRMRTSLDHEKLEVYQKSVAVECSACLEVIVAKRFAKPQDVAAGKSAMVEVVSMLFGMIRANSDVRLYESAPEYLTTAANENGKRNTNNIRNKNKRRTLKQVAVSRS